MEEVRAGLDTDREGEDRQTEDAHGARHLNDDALGHAPGGKTDAGEEHGGRTEADSLDLDVPDEHAQADEKEQHEDGIVRQVGEDGDHDGVPAFRAPCRWARARIESRAGTTGIVSSARDRGLDFGPL